MKIPSSLIYPMTVVAAVVVGAGLFAAVVGTTGPVGILLSVLGIAALVGFVGLFGWLRVSRHPLIGRYEHWARDHPRHLGVIYGLVMLPFFGGLALGSRSPIPKINLIISALALAVIVFSPELDRLMFHRRQ